MRQYDHFKICERHGVESRRLDDVVIAEAWMARATDSLADDEGARDEADLGPHEAEDAAIARIDAARAAETAERAAFRARIAALIAEEEAARRTAKEIEALLESAVVADEVIGFDARVMRMDMNGGLIQKIGSRKAVVTSEQGALEVIRGLRRSVSWKQRSKASRQWQCRVVAA